MVANVIHTRQFLRKDVSHPRNGGKTYGELQMEVERLTRLLQTKQTNLESTVISNESIRRRCRMLDKRVSESSRELRQWRDEANSVNMSLKILAEQKKSADLKSNNYKLMTVGLRKNVQFLEDAVTQTKNEVANTNHANEVLIRENYELRDVMGNLNKKNNQLLDKLQKDRVKYVKACQKLADKYQSRVERKQKLSQKIKSLALYLFNFCYVTRNKMLLVLDKCSEAIMHRRHTQQLQGASKKRQKYWNKATAEVAAIQPKAMQDDYFLKTDAR